MNVIPVIDLKAGEVVLAQRGARHLYAPIRTRLSPTSRPADVIAGFLALYPFRTIYVADLDAIEGKGSHSACLAELEALFPEVEVWVDSGIGEQDGARAWLAKSRGELVLGSESLKEADLCQSPDIARRCILSLDFRVDKFQGPSVLLESESLWPQRIIVMTLARVGSGAGPDLTQLAEISMRAAGRHQIYAAGGVRGPEDLAALAQIGLAGVLVASALHDGKITAADLARA